MTKSQVIALLKANRNERGIAHWQKLGPGAGLPGAAGLKSFGLGLTQLRKLAKQVGRDHALAEQLWQSDVYDAKVLGLLIDDPKQMTRQQAEQRVGEVSQGMLTHVFASCDAPLAKTPFAFELAREWVVSKDATRRRCGYALVYELSKDKKNKALEDAFFLGCIERIASSIHKEDNWVKDAMNAALLGIGKRNLKLNAAAVRAAKAIGPVEIDYGDTGCEPVDVLRHLTGAALSERLGSRR